MAREAFLAQKIDFEFIDILADPKNLKTMLKHSDGKLRIPVIVTGDRVEMGFRGRT
jgi:arsenate reductase-like glutaredoxin family protein